MSKQLLTITNQLASAIEDVQRNIKKSQETGEQYSDIIDDLEMIKNGIKEIVEIDKLFEQGNAIITNSLKNI